MKLMTVKWLAALVFGGSLSGFSCDQGTAPVLPAAAESRQVSRPRVAAPKRASPAAASPAPLSAIPVPDRLVAIGDLHGDLAATKEALRLAGAIDASDRWIGEDLTIVQTGDVLDRGNDEPEIYQLLWDLGRAAEPHGGRVVLLNGNHELMNAAGDLRYVTENGLEDFAHVDAGALDAQGVQVPSSVRGRLAAFLPGGAWAVRLAENPIVALVGDTLFAHGGVRQEHVSFGLAKLNRLASEWLRGDLDAPPGVLTGTEAPVWTRRYSEQSPAPDVCRELEAILQSVGAKRMVVGHTVQSAGIAAGCERKLWRIDVGLSAYYGAGPTQVLEIDDGTAKVLSE